MSQTTGNYDFGPINKITNNMTTGMKLAIADGLIQSCLTTMEKFENPLAPEVHTIGQELKEFRMKYKASKPAP